MINFSTMRNLWKIIACVFLICVVNCNEVEEASVHLDLLEMDLSDYCSNLSKTSRDIFLKKPNAYKYKLETLKNYGQFSKKESEDLRKSYHIKGLKVPDSFKHRWNILETMGDSELPEQNWTNLVKFELGMEQIVEELQIPCNAIPCDKIPCVNRTSDCKYSRHDVAKMLRNSHDANYLRAVWSAAQKDYSSKGKYYQDILKLVETAAKANGFSTPEDYWSNLVQYPEVYKKADDLWEEIQPFYKKFIDFVKLRLEQVYRINSNESIPVYLLGSEKGLDLTLIANKILPHRYLYDEISASLHHEGLSGRRLYEFAEKLTRNLGFKKLDQIFWTRSMFNMSCPSRFLLYCGDKYSQVITCNATGFSEFLDAHEDMTRASLNQIDYYPSFYHDYRYSIIDEALTQLSTILAMKTLTMNNLIPDEVLLVSGEANHNQMTALLMTAFRILPKLSYYYLADKFRLSELKDLSQNINEKWWEYRENYQHVKGETNTEWDLLGDEYIYRNKPYVGKFLGTILQFQILDHFENNGEDHINILSRMSKDKSLKGLIKRRLNDHWMGLLEEFGIYDIDVDAILEYFKPLEEYMDNAPLKQVTQTLIPRTTTTVSTTTITTTTTTESSTTVNVPRLVTNAPVQHIKETFPKEVKENVNKVVDKEKEEEDDADHTHKAAWIGALIGILSLLIIAGIIGQKKCKRRPMTNNRRFDV